MLDKETIRPNEYGARCVICDEWVYKDKGFIIEDNKDECVYCVECLNLSINNASK